MIAFQQPCGDFTASDLISLQAISPEGAHRNDADGDRFLVCQQGEEALAVDHAPQRQRRSIGTGLCQGTDTGPYWHSTAVAMTTRVGPIGSMTTLADLTGEAVPRGAPHQ